VEQKIHFLEKSGAKNPLFRKKWSKKSEGFGSTFFSAAYERLSGAKNARDLDQPFSAQLMKG
jgi:hypothetical protein